MDSGIYARYLPPETAREIFGGLDVITAGWLSPAGIARVVDGGYRVEGHWRFGSGCTHAGWIAAGCTVFRGDEPVFDSDGSPLWRVVLARRDAFTILDTWRSTGLAGSGSHDYTATDLFVPTEHSFSFAEPVHPGALTLAPEAINRKMPGVPLGAARAALDFIYDLAERRRERPSGQRWSASPRIWRVVAECEMRLAAARCLVYASLDEQWEHLTAGQEVPRRLRATVALARVGAFRTAREIASTLYDLVGGDAIYAYRTPLDRIHRDLMTGCQHVVAQGAMLEHAGAVLFGTEPDYEFI